jgi:hypothetical protein
VPADTKYTRGHLAFARWKRGHIAIRDINFICAHYEMTASSWGVRVFDAATVCLCIYVCVVYGVVIAAFLCLCPALALEIREWTTGNTFISKGLANAHKKRHIFGYVSCLGLGLMSVCLARVFGVAVLYFPLYTWDGKSLLIRMKLC